MKRRDPDVYLGHIEDAIRDVNQYLGDYTWEEFLDDGKTQDAVMRKLEVIGEAVKNFPEEFLEKWPDVPWRDIADFRNVLIHEYFDVDLEEVWNTVKNDLPVLGERIRGVREKIKKDAG
ncbi:hypothetical protein A2634_03240 [Candidatus Amesbacteria bacterium RIFCSPHIGHO2_01_FULL_48_32]|uniref:DUF86 domain-containing protein n=1 Tax=Candidatus Amesbacteria bacterium RIFCSPLOWO2_01_FULL_48_25 TaxID=1797259 RepID=A0A1F4ZCU6_9BACT|nr:MAG: hypothetical protein A2634_03240 [Candidatus Amesbacteria bacterium RIFCSPHIGHO2_01_FULL_48_32]OGD03577.1 MAG: hypothetical protein A2989_02750 [Candidatus Amesbacteria bacterium RIFCSPLOWO2_01_FULL_48_25]HJZ04675.1 DUF86 domain-containing protein [Patescibacteria group bacterium]